ncbi:MAG: rod shape-determining protein RodA [Flavobacteriales bacterium]|nr:rod shape-determining protein RodA [Flavobacteriales bacterium]
MRKAKNIFENIDVLSIVLYIFLLFFGWINIYASQYNEDINFVLDFNSRYGKQIFFIIISTLVAFILLIIDWKFFFTLSYLFYICIIFLLVGVLLVGDVTGGASSWYKIGGFKFQPSEFAKFASALALAKYYNGILAKKMDMKQKIFSYSLIIIPFLLIILQNDLGTALTFTSFVLVFYREGLSGNILIFGFIILVLFITSLLFEKLILIYILFAISTILCFLSRKEKKQLYLIISSLIISCSFILSVNYFFENILSDHHRKRINVLIGKEFDPQGAGYNLIQSKIAIGSGGLFGKGFLSGTQTRFDFVPEQSTDFIFCTIGEEWGFFGSLFFFSIYLGLLVRILFLAERQRSNFSRIYGYSVASILFAHFVINIGMTIGLLPVIGIPLPFISYGGSSLIGFTILLFIFINLDSYRLQILR